MDNKDLFSRTAFVSLLNRKRHEQHAVMAEEYAEGYALAMKDVAKTLLELPPAEVVDVVRCAECIHASPLVYEGKPVWSCRWNVYLRKGDHYCKLGERRTEE